MASGPVLGPSVVGWSGLCVGSLEGEPDKNPRAGHRTTASQCEVALASITSRPWWVSRRPGHSSPATSCRWKASGCFQQHPDSSRCRSLKLLILSTVVLFGRSRGGKEESGSLSNYTKETESLRIQETSREYSSCWIRPSFILGWTKFSSALWPLPSVLFYKEWRSYVFFAQSQTWCRESVTLLQWRWWWVWGVRSQIQVHTPALPRPGLGLWAQGKSLLASDVRILPVKTGVLALNGVAVGSDEILPYSVRAP